MTKITEWAERYYAQHPKGQVHCMERKDDMTGLYMVKHPYGDGRPCYMWTTPRYYAWINNELRLVTENYIVAHQKYKNEI